MRCAILASLAFLLALPSPLEAKTQLKIVVSFSILQNVAQQIAGEHATATSIVGANQDTHVFEPTPATNQLILQADLVIINGFNFETWIERVIKASGYKGIIVNASEGIKPIILEKSRSPDPHVWNDVSNVKRWVHNIEIALQKIDPTNKASYQRNARTYLEKLNQLDDWIRSQFQDIPTEDRKIITAHDAFSYYGQAYKIRFLAPMGLSTETEPSAFAIAQLIKQIRQKKISVLFVENITNDKVIRQISAETGITIGGTLYSDALSLPDQPGSNYIKLMRHNTELFMKALR